MRAQIALFSLFVLIMAACGGQPPAAVTTPEPTVPITVAGQTATPVQTPQPTVASTPQPTATPTGLIVEVKNDADVEKLFIGMTADEVTNLVNGSASNGKDGFKVALPFDPHGVKFQLRELRVKHQAGDVYTVFAIFLQEGTATVKTVTPSMHLVGKLSFGSEMHYVIYPMDEAKATVRPEGKFYSVKNVGGEGVFIELPESASLVGTLLGVGTALNTDNSSGWIRGVGKTLFTLSATKPPMKVWNPNPHIIVRGRGLGGDPDGSTITRDSLLKAADGRIVYIK